MSLSHTHADNSEFPILKISTDKVTQSGRKPSVALVSSVRKVAMTSSVFGLAVAFILLCREFIQPSSGLGSIEAARGGSSFPSHSRPKDLAFAASTTAVPTPLVPSPPPFTTSTSASALTLTPLTSLSIAPPQTSTSMPTATIGTVTSSNGSSVLSSTSDDTSTTASEVTTTEHVSSLHVQNAMTGTRSGVKATAIGRTVTSTDLNLTSIAGYDISTLSSPSHDQEGHSVNGVSTSDGQFRMPTEAGVLTRPTTSTSTATPSSDAANGLSLGFEGTSCLSRAEIWDPFRRFCRKELSEPFYCGRAHHSDQCGWYRQGRFGVIQTREDDSHRPSPIPVRSYVDPHKVLNTTPFVMSSASLESLYAEIVHLSAKKGSGSGTEDTCSNPRAFGSRIDPSTLAFEGKRGQAKAQNTACPFDYVPFGAPIAAVLHHHAVVSGRAEGRRGIIISGDSMMRQLFHHIIASIRGQDRVADYVFHNSGVYAVMPDGDAYYDGLHHEELKGFLEHWFPKKKGADSGANHEKRASRSIHWSLRHALFAVMFVWDPSPDPKRVDYPFVATSIGGHLYWNTDMAKYPAYHEAMEDLLTNVKTRTSSSDGGGEIINEGGGGQGFKHIHVTIPYRSTNFNETYRQESNALNYRWTEGTAYSSQHKGGVPAPYLHQAGQKRLWTLDFAALEDANNATKANITKVSDDLHYQCGLHIGGLKSNGMGCRDPMNEALMQWLIQLLLRL